MFWNPLTNNNAQSLAMPAWVAGLVAVVSAITMAVAQQWLGVPAAVMPILQLLGVAMALILLSVWVPKGWSAVMFIGGLALLCLLGYAPAWLSNPMVGLLALLGQLAWVLTGMVAFKQTRFWPWLGTTLMALLLGWWLATYLYGYMYTPALGEELLAGTYTGDTLFHAAVANMIRTYNVASTGLHFAPVLHYHVGAHWAIAQLATVLNVSVLHAYQMVSTIMFVPMLVFATLGLSNVWVAITRPDYTKTAPVMGTGLATVLLYFAISNGLPTMMTDDLLVDFFSLIRSESYLLSVVVSLGLILWVVQQPLNSHGRPAWLTVAVTAVCLPSIFILKVSTGMMLLGGLGYVWLRLGGFKQWSTLLWCAVGVGLCLLAYKWFTPGVYMLQKQSLAFLHNYVHTDFWGYFILAHSFWVWLYAAVRVAQVAPVSLPDWATNITNGKFMLLETLLVMTVVSYIPMMTTITKGGAAIYFTDVVKWLALPFALATVLVPLTHWLQQKILAKKQLGRYAVVWLAVLVFAITNVGEVVAQSKRLFKSHGSNMRAMRTLPPQAQKQAFYEKLQVLNQLEDKAHALVYIPKSNRFFWQEWLENRRDGAERACKYAPLSVPAITGLAMVYGQPPNDCPHLDGYGFKPYLDAFDPTVLTQFTAAPCAFISKKGYTTLYRFDDGANLTTVECPIKKPT
jgi:hypothetical protein